MIKAFGLEDRQSALFAADAEDTGKKNMRVARIDARFDPNKAFNIEQATFNDYMAKLGEVSDTDIRQSVYV